MINKIVGSLAEAIAGVKDDSVVLIHTGGTPALFAYQDVLAEGIAPRRP